MTRLLLTLAAALPAAPAFGQGFTNPLPTPPPIPVAGTRLAYPAASTFTPRAFYPAMPYGYGLGYGLGYGAAFGPWGGYYPYYSPYSFGYGSASPWFGGFYGGGFYYSSPYTTQAWGTSFYAPSTVPPLQGAGGNGAGVAQAAINPVLDAELTVEFPASADVTLNGQPAAGEGPVRTLKSPPLKAGQHYAFAVKAEWSQGGKRYEWERTVTLGPGERSRLTVSRGFPVKD